MNAIIIIDTQNDFSNIINDHFKNSLKKLLKYAEIFHYQIIWVKTYYGQVDPETLDTSDRLKGTHIGKTKLCVKDTNGAKIIDDFQPYLTQSNNHTIIKTYYSAFTNTSLHNLLTQQNIKNLVFCGLTVNTCLKATIQDALQS